MQSIQWWRSLSCNAAPTCNGVVGGNACCNKTSEAVGRTSFLYSRCVPGRRDYLEERVVGRVVEVLNERVRWVRSIDDGCFPISKSYWSGSVHVLYFISILSEHVQLSMLSGWLESLRHCMHDSHCIHVITVASPSIFEMLVSSWALCEWEIDGTSSSFGRQVLVSSCSTHSGGENEESVTSGIESTCGITLEGETRGWGDTVVGILIFPLLVEHEVNQRRGKSLRGSWTGDEGGEYWVSYISSIKDWTAVIALLDGEGTLVVVGVSLLLWTMYGIRLISLLGDEIGLVGGGIVLCIYKRLLLSMRE